MANKRLPTFNRATREAISQDADAEFVQVVDALPEYLQDMARFAYLTSWRRGDLLGLRRATASDADPAARRYYYGYCYATASPASTNSPKSNGVRGPNGFGHSWDFGEFALAGEATA